MSDQARRPFSTADLLGETFQHFSQLVKSEIALAKAEVADRISTKAMGGAWMMVGGALCLLAFAFALEAAVFAIAARGIALHWACLIVACGLLLIGLAFTFYGRSSLQQSIAPQRSLRQLNRDAAVAREQVQ